MTIRTALVRLPINRLEEPYSSPGHLSEAEEKLMDYLEGRALDYKKISQGRFYKIDREQEVAVYKFKINACNLTLIELWRDGLLSEMRSPLREE